MKMPNLTSQQDLCVSFNSSVGVKTNKQQKKREERKGHSLI